MKRACEVAALASSATRSRSAAPSAKRRSRPARSPPARRWLSSAAAKASTRAERIRRRQAATRPRSARPRSSSAPSRASSTAAGPSSEAAAAGSEARSERPARERVGDRDRDVGQRPLDRARGSGRAGCEIAQRGQRRAGDRQRQRDGHARRGTSRRRSPHRRRAPPAGGAPESRASSPRVRPAAAAPAPAAPSGQGRARQHRLARRDGGEPAGRRADQRQQARTALIARPSIESAHRRRRRAPARPRRSRPRGARRRRVARCWTTRSMPRCTCSAIASCGSPTPAISASVSSRASASAGELACTVESAPSCPVLSAVSRSSASAPRTSPITIRSGRIRSALRSRSRIVTSPLPSTLAGRLSSRTTWRLLQAQLGRVLDRHHPLAGRDEAGERVEQRRLARAGAAADQDAAPPGDGRLEQLAAGPGSACPARPARPGPAARRRSGGSRAPARRSPAAGSRR